MLTTGAEHDAHTPVSPRWQTAERLGQPRAAAIALAAAALTGTHALATTSEERERIERIAQQVIESASNQADLRPGTHDLLRLSFVLQTRFIANSGADGPDGNEDDWESGFNIPRARIIVRGDHPDIPVSYSITGEFTPGGDAMSLIDAFVTWKVDDAWQLRAGQFKAPLTRESDMISSTRALLADISIAARTFRLNYTQGLQLIGTAERVRGFFAFTDGRNTTNADFTDERVAEAALTARGEYRFGEASWRQYADMTAFRDAPTGALLGLAGHWQQGGSTTAPARLGEHANLWAWSSDFSIEGSGWNAMASFSGRTVEARGESITDLGIMAQGGAFVTDQTELLARYAHVFPDSDRGDNTDDFAAVTVGMNYYLIPESHAAKLTAELTWYPTAQGDSAAIISASDTLGLLADSDGDQWTFILQMQLVF